MMIHFIRWFSIAIFAACTIDTAAQSIDSNIKAAKGTAATAAKSNPNAQPDSVRWKIWGNTNIGATQTWFENWLAGGEPSITFNGNLSLFANYKKNKLFWENNAYLAYGIVKKSHNKAIKNDDQINLGSRIGYELAKNWYYSANFLGKTQFSPGYKYSATDTIRISDFFAPAHFYLSLGLDFKPSSRFSLHLSPLMGKSTLVRSDDVTVLKSAGLNQELIDKGKHVRNEFGGGLIFNLNGSFMSKKISYNTQLELFSNYLEKPANIDAIWNFTFNIALAKHVSSSIRIDMTYDDNKKTVRKELNNEGKLVDVQHGAKLQVKQFFQIGFFYSF
ncbi:MAG: DUF3078 domain-containing protein [Bacteroidales bacterium]|jgi:hypothetical protein|nr:DUF3078 domain-containing protein [Bacteroidales bacterium]